jgi:hypothetical protein
MPTSTILILSVADAFVRLLLFAMVGFAGFLWLLHAAAARSASVAGHSTEPGGAAAGFTWVWFSNGFGLPGTLKKGKKSEKIKWWLNL